MNLSTIYRTFGRIYRQRQPSINYRRLDPIYRAAITRNLPAALKSSLPSIEEIEAELGDAHA